MIFDSICTLRFIIIFHFCKMDFLWQKKFFQPLKQAKKRSSVELRFFSLNIQRNIGLLEMPFRSTQDDSAGNALTSRGQEPRDGIRNIESEEIVEAVHGENEVDPEEAEAANDDHAEKHGDERIADTAHDTRKDLHIAAQDIGGGEQSQAHQGDLNALEVTVHIGDEDLLAEEELDAADDKPNDRDEQKGAEDDLFHTVIAARADILTDEGEGCLVDGILRDVNEGIERA